MNGFLVYCLTLIVGSLWFSECYGADPAMKPSLSEKERALVTAALNNDWTEMIKLVNEGVNMDIVDDYGRSPLSYAAEESTAKIVEKLINVGVDHIVSKRIKLGDKSGNEQLKIKVAENLVNKRDSDSGLPITKAVKKGKKSIFDILVKYGARPSEDEALLRYAARKCHTELARSLIDDHHFKVDGANFLKQTALHSAAFGNCNLDFIKFLVSKGADVNACDNMGQSPLHRAAGFGCAEAVEALIKLGAELEIRDNPREGQKLGLTPFELADAKGLKTADLVRDAINNKKNGKSVAGAHKDTTTAGAHANSL